MKNNTENKFGNFLNFMKKFLAVSFFCAVAAFGFGASNAWAAIDDTQKANYTDVNDVKNSSNQISALGDSSDLNGYYEDGDVLYYSANGSNDAMAYALKRTSPAGTKVDKTDLEIDANKTVNNNKINKIHTQLIDDGVKNLTIKGYTNDGTGNVTVSGTTDGTKQFDTLTVLKADGNAVDQTTLNNAKTYFTTTKAVSKNVKTLTDNTDTGDNNGGTGTGDSGAGETSGSGSSESGSGSSNGNGSGSSESGSGSSNDDTNIKTQAKIDLNKIEYESGKTTWGDVLVKAGVNTVNGATGVWKVKAGSLSGDLVNYGTKTDEYLSSILVEPGLESATLTYVQGENDKFSDSGNIVISLKGISEDVDDDVDKEKFGEQQTFGNQKFYVNDKTGETSAVITAEKNKITWLRESSDGTAAWYGFNNNSSGNSQAALPEGSIVSVNWINREQNPEEFDKKIEEVISGDLTSLGLSVEDNKIWLFELNAYKKSIDDNGNITWEKVDKSDFKDKMEVYIELGDDWDMSDVNTIWLDNKEQLTTPSIVTKEINGVSKRFAVFKLDHFSTYAIYDEQEVNDIFAKVKEFVDEAQAAYLKEHPNATKEELEDVAEQAVLDAYNNLSDKDKEQIDKYFTKNSQDQNNASTSDKSGSTNNNSGNIKTSDLNSTSNYSNSSYTASSGTKTDKNENLSALLFLLSTSSILPLNAVLRKKYFN